MMPPVPHLVALEHHQCQWCLKEFPVPVVTKSGKAPRPMILVVADHELKCEKNPDRPVIEKESKAWKPEPWLIEMGGTKAKPQPTTLTFMDGPWQGRQTNWEMHLVDGTCVTLQPPKIIAGPVTTDSATPVPRSCSKYMGHYELELLVRPKEGGFPEVCPVYVWVPTIIPKKRLAKATPFAEAWPELAAELTVWEPPEEEEDQDGYQPESPDPDGSDQGDDPSLLG